MVGRKLCGQTMPLQFQLNSMKKITEKITYEVCSYVDKNGRVAKNKKDATIMCATALSGVMRGISVPYSMKLSRQLGLNVGDRFIETVTQTRIDKK